MNEEAQTKLFLLAEPSSITAIIAKVGGDSLTLIITLPSACFVYLQSLLSMPLCLCTYKSLSIKAVKRKT